MRAFAAIVLSLASCSALCAEREGGLWPVAESNDFRHLIIENANPSRSADGIDCRWIVLHDGEPFASGKYDLKGMKPGERHAYAMPSALAEAKKLGGTQAVRLRFVVGETELARRQVDLPEAKPPQYVPAEGGEIEVVEDGGTLKFSVNGLAYSFSRQTGLLTGIVRKGFFSDDTLLSVPMELTVWGAASETFAYAAEPIAPIERREDGVRFRAVTKAVGKDWSALLVLDWQLFRDGSLACRSWIRPLRDQVLKPRVGFRFHAPVQDSQVFYFAADPLLGRWSAETPSFAARKAPIGGARAMEVRAGSYQLGFAGIGRPFAFSAEPSEKSVGVCVFPDADGDRRRPQQLDFMIGPRRFANVVGVN